MCKGSSWSRGQRVIGSRPAGTSSILAGALLAAVYRCTGQTYDTDSLIHAVLYLEQMLTTGAVVSFSSSTHKTLYFSSYYYFCTVDSIQTSTYLSQLGINRVCFSHWHHECLKKKTTHFQSSSRRSRLQIETPFKCWNIPQFVFIQGCIHLSNHFKTF